MSLDPTKQYRFKEDIFDGNMSHLNSTMYTGDYEKTEYEHNDSWYYRLYEKDCCEGRGYWNIEEDDLIEDGPRQGYVGCDEEIILSDSLFKRR